MATPDEIYGVAVNKLGQIVVTFSDHVEVLAPDGAVQNVPVNYSNSMYATVMGNKLSSANRARVDDEGRVYVPEYAKGCVSIFSAGGVLMHELHSPHRNMKPVGVALGLKNQIFVSDFDNKCIHCFNVEWIPEQRFFVRIFKIESSYQGRFGNLCMPMGLAVDNQNRVFVAERASISVFDGDSGTPIGNTRWNPGASDDSIMNPTDIAVGPNGTVYVTDFSKSFIHVYQENPNDAKNWNILKIVGCHGGDFGQLRRPMGVAVDQNLNIYVADSKNRRIQIFIHDSLEVHVLEKENGTWTQTVGKRNNTRTEPHIPQRNPNRRVHIPLSPYFPTA
jgi:sugar lactone lactonase YvrE